METYEVLEKALALIEDEKDWCPNGWGSDAGGKCAAHAIHANVPHLRGIDAQLAVERLTGCYLGEFNDTHTHAEVVALFKRAIRSEKAKAGIPVELPAESLEVQA